MRLKQACYGLLFIIKPKEEFMLVEQGMGSIKQLRIRQICACTMYVRQA